MFSRLPGVPYIKDLEPPSNVSLLEPNTALTTWTYLHALKPVLNLLWAYFTWFQTWTNAYSSWFKSDIPCILWACPSWPKVCMSPGILLLRTRGLLTDAFKPGSLPALSSSKSYLLTRVRSWTPNSNYVLHRLSLLQVGLSGAYCPWEHNYTNRKNRTAATRTYARNRETN